MLRSLFRILGYALFVLFNLGLMAGLWKQYDLSPVQYEVVHWAWYIGLIIELPAVVALVVAGVVFRKTVELAAHLLAALILAALSNIPVIWFSFYREVLPGVLALPHLPPGTGQVAFFVMFPTFSVLLGYSLGYFGSRLRFYDEVVSQAKEVFSRP